MLFAGWEVRMVKNCERELKNAGRGRRPRAFSRPRSQFFGTTRKYKSFLNTFKYGTQLV